MAFRTVLQMDSVIEKASNDEKTDINSVLPAEMLFLTFLQLSPEDLEVVQEVCRLWKKVGESACRELDRLELVKARREQSDLLCRRRLQDVRKATWDTFSTRKMEALLTGSLQKTPLTESLQKALLTESLQKTVAGGIYSGKRRFRITITPLILLSDNNLKITAL